MEPSLFDVKLVPVHIRASPETVREVSAIVAAVFREHSLTTRQTAQASTR
jgi:hypothetical protein